MGKEMLHTLVWICQGTDAKMGLDVQEISWRKEPERQGAPSDHSRGLTPVEGEGEGRKIG